MKKVWSRFISIPKRHDSLSFHPQSSNNFFIVISSLVELEREKTLRDLGTISPRVKTWGPRGESQVVFRRDENNLFFSFVSSPFFLSFFSFLFFSTSSFDVQNSKGVRVVPRWWSRFGKLAALLCCHSLARRQWIRFKSRRLAEIRAASSGKMCRETLAWLTPIFPSQRLVRSWIFEFLRFPFKL